MLKCKPQILMITVWLASIFLLYSFSLGAEGYRAQGNTSYAGFSGISPDKNHFIVVGDTQGTSHWEFWRGRNDRERKLIALEMAKRKPAFIVHLGDLTTRGNSKKQWKEFDTLHGASRQKGIPYFPVLGNHDLYGIDTKALQHYFDRFPHLRGKRWYSFTWKTIGLILVDSNFSSLTEEEKESQEKWYISELKRFEKNPSIYHAMVFCHEPPFTNSLVVQPNKKVKASFADPFLQFRKTRFFMSGHSHSYERFQIDGKFFVVSGGGGGPRHNIAVPPGTPPYNDLFLGSELRFFHFIEIENSRLGMTFKVFKLESDRTFTIVDPSAINSSSITNPIL